jgi:uncharacterized YigZ family protein
MDPAPYRSVAGHVQTHLTIQGSRFIADAAPAASAAEAEELLLSLRSRYHDATHHCYAYSIGTDSSVVRYSDDGEPSGTAGIKILSAIRSKQISDVVVIVTRYFGGTKLGVGGLGRAYQDAATQALGKCSPVVRTPVRELSVHFSFTDTNAVMNAVSRQQIGIAGTTYTQAETVLRLQVPLADVDRFVDVLKNATHGKAVVVPGGIVVVTSG